MNQSVAIDAVKQLLPAWPLLVYYVIGHVLTSRAFRHVRDPKSVPDFLMLYRADCFRAEGQPLRKLALWYWWIGFPVAVGLTMVAWG